GLAALRCLAALPPRRSSDLDSGAIRARAPLQQPRPPPWTLWERLQPRALLARVDKLAVEVAPTRVKSCHGFFIGNRRSRAVGGVTPTYVASTEASMATSM